MEILISHTCAIINPRFVYLLPHFWKPFPFLQGGFVQKILTLWMVSIQEWFVIKSRLILQTIYSLNKEIFQYNLLFIIKSSFRSRAGYNDACTVFRKTFDAFPSDLHWCKKHESLIILDKNINSCHCDKRA